MGFGERPNTKRLQEEMIMHLEIESTVIAAANPDGQVPSTTITVMVMIIIISGLIISS